MTLRDMAPRAFRLAWHRYGRPSMTVVQALTNWLLPAGFGYDPHADQVRNAAGAVLPNPEDYWVTSMVYVVPQSQGADLRSLVAAGMLASGTVQVSILAADVPTVRTAHAVQLDDIWYTVKDVQHDPPGTGAAGVWATVTLSRRGRA